MQKNYFDLFLVVKCRDWNETQTRRVTQPADVYTKFEIDIPKHVEKSPGKFEKSETRKNSRQKFKNMFCAQNGIYVNKDTVGRLCTNFE